MTLISAKLGTSPMLWMIGHHLKKPIIDAYFESIKRFMKATVISIQNPNARKKQQHESKKRQNLDDLTTEELLEALQKKRRIELAKKKDEDKAKRNGGSEGEGSEEGSE